MASGPDRLRVEWTDGRVQEFSIVNFTGDGTDLGASLTEERDGQLTLAETTSTPVGK